MDMRPTASNTIRTDATEAGKALRNLWGSRWMDLTGGVTVPKAQSPDPCVVRVLLGAHDKDDSHSSGHFDVAIDVCGGTLLRAAVQNKA